MAVSWTKIDWVQHRGNNHEAVLLVVALHCGTLRASLPRAGCMKLSLAVRINGPRGNTADQVRARVLRKLSETDNVARSAQQNSEKNRNGFLPPSLEASYCG